MKVSILIPCYNARAYVGAAVASALRQSWDDLEIIVVDDGSTDGSGEVLDAIRDTRVTVIHQENRGQCAAANVAFARSTGMLVKFFDADDLLSPDHVQLQVMRLGARQDAVAMGEWARFSADDPQTARFDPLPMYRDATPADWLTAEWMNAKPMMQCGLWLMPRGILEQSGLWDERLSLINDFEFFARVLTHAREILHVPGARLYYRTGGSLSATRSRGAVESAYQSLLLGTQHLLNASDTPTSRRACANVLQDFVFTYFPGFADLRRKARARIAELGGSDLEPDGPPGFQKLRPFVGWKLARLIQHAAEQRNLNGAGRRRLRQTT